MDLVRRAEWLVDRPWRLVLLALLLVLPLVVSGELAAQDTRARVQQSEFAQLRAGATRTADLVSGRMRGVLDQLVGVSATQRFKVAAGLVVRRTTESPPEVVDAPDLRELGFELAAVHAGVREDVSALVLVDGAGIVVARDPAGGSPEVGADVRGYAYATEIFGRSPHFTGTDDTGMLSVAVPMFPGDTATTHRVAGPSGLLLAILERSAMQRWLSPIADTVADAYVLDERDRLIARATTATAIPPPDLSTAPIVGRVSAGHEFLGQGIDPVTGEPRLLASTPVRELDWHVIVAAGPEALASEVDTALAQQRALRVGLSVALLLGAVLVGAAGSAALRRRREALSALEQQTAIAEILKVMSRSPTDVQPTLDAIAKSASEFCDAPDVLVNLLEGGANRIRSHYGTLEVRRGQSPEVYRALTPHERLDGSVSGRAMLERRTLHVTDLQAETARYPLGAAASPSTRAILAAPLLRETGPVGAIILRRPDSVPFTDRQIELVETFADQAVIAIENVRLFNETKEALERQTATADVLRVMASSPSDLQPVLDAIADRARRLCAADGMVIRLLEADGLVVAARAGTLPAVGQDPHIPVARDTLTGAAVLDAHTIHIADVQEAAEYPRAREMAMRGGHRTIAAIPLLREGRSIGVFSLARQEVRPYSEHELALVQTFADQAVIAIENVRLFNETKEALERQTAVSEVLKTMSRSAFDLDAVLAAVVESAARLSNADLGWLGRMEDGLIRGGGAGVRWARDGDDSVFGGMGRVQFVPTRNFIMGRAIIDRRTIRVADIAADTEMSGDSGIARVSGSRSMIAVPLLLEGEAIGAIVVARRIVRRFSDREVQVVETFADQAAIAIQNVRLFNEIQDKSRELEAANRHKSEFLANMSHELRTPLNAIIGFSEVLLEAMFGEINTKQREYLDDVLASGKHLLSLINDILDLSKVEAGKMELELSTFPLAGTIENALTIMRERAARHGIALQTILPADLPPLEADERKLKQVLINLLSNAVKFTPDGGSVEVRVRREDEWLRIDVHDTGIGIAAEDQPRVFEEFRQVGRERAREGTGLGLTLTKRFVELHGGRIWVESAPGQGSTFSFTLPPRQTAPVRV